MFFCLTLISMTFIYFFLNSMILTSATLQILLTEKLQLYNCMILMNYKLLILSFSLYGINKLYSFSNPIFKLHNFNFSEFYTFY